MIITIRKQLAEELDANNRHHTQIESMGRYASSWEQKNRAYQAKLVEERITLQKILEENELLKKKIQIYLNEEETCINDITVASNNRINLQLIVKQLTNSQVLSKTQIELLVAKINKLSVDNSSLLKVIAEKDNLYQTLLKQNSSEGQDISELIADHLTLQYLITEKYLKTKTRPAIKQVADIKELRIELRNYIQKYKQLKYSFELLKKSVPILDDFIEDDLYDLSSALAENLDDEIDEVSKWLSKKEYENLDITERNELALENYLNGRYKKSKWQIGRDYEMFVGFTYEAAGYKVQYTGIKEKFNDLGRDLICLKNDEVLIIQCKYWSNQKVIRENAIAQLYGTSIMYELEKNYIPGFIGKIESILVTNITLSPMAKQFASRLGVKVRENIQMGTYPSIKCNVTINPDNTISKIYHLPMDQMYDRTEIIREGELYVDTVRKAESRGFRRAKKFLVNKNGVN